MKRDFDEDKMELSMKSFPKYQTIIELSTKFLNDIRTAQRASYAQSYFGE